MSTPHPTLPERFDFPAEEERTLALWKQLDAFKRSLELSADSKEFTFYDGPPFATGLPHYGHILAGTIKDVVTRYATQTGHYVSRRFGWDTHGVPVEQEINKKFNIKGREDVLSMGIAKYNAECRSIVMRYAKEWEEVVTRMGRWIDFKNDYKTLEPWYMESVWWVFRSLWDKGLVYRSFRVMPYSTGLNTALSNFEAGENFRDVQDPAIVVSFPITKASDALVLAATAAGKGEDLASASFVAWTTTPWTLPSNLALCVHPDFTYCLVLDTKTGSKTVLAEARIGQLYPKFAKHMSSSSDKVRALADAAVKAAAASAPSSESSAATSSAAIPSSTNSNEKSLLEAAMRSARTQIASEYKGTEFSILFRVGGEALVGSTYEALFPYFLDEYATTSFRVVSDTYVTDDAGTGIVHQAPAFGEDDFRVCDRCGIFDKTSGNIPCPLDENGRFTSQVPDFAGVYIKDADDAICAALKAKGRLVDKGSIVHSVGFCPRSETPLIRRVVPSWFVKVESIKEKLLANNMLTHWVPDFVKEKRFHNWLKDAHDWNVSRTRYWGTTLPIWTSDDYTELRVFGSIAELEEAIGGGVKVTDLHRESVDSLLVPSLVTPGRMLKRVEEVFDCWFESGAMPYAQIHYPFENKEGFEQSKFPADFIAEGLDQTRGWFYTLLVLSTALFDKPAFKNVVVNGLVLAEDGKKMSKRLKNYPDPSAIVNNYGADALRLYLINSPVVRAEPLRFKEDGVLAVVKDLLLPWYNALRFFCQNAARFDSSVAGSGSSSSSSSSFIADPELSRSSENAMDRWVVASLQGLIAFVRREMAAYRLYTVVPRLVQFIDDLTNWYVRLNRRRLRGGDGDKEARTALSTLHLVLLSLARVMAPFTPFLVEFMFQHLRRFVQKTSSSAIAAGGAGGDPRSVECAESVHYTFIPEVDATLLNESLEARVKVMMQVIELGRLARDKRGISLKTPVRSVVVVHADAELLQGISILQDYIKDELNALDFSVTSDEASWASLRADPNMATLGKRLGKDLKAACAEIKALSHDALASFGASGSIQLKTCPNVVLVTGDLIVKREVHEKVASQFECAVDKAGLVLVAIDAVQDDVTRSLGCAREATNRVQKLRKKAGLDVSDVVNIFYTVTPLPLGWTGSTEDAGGEDAIGGSGDDQAVTTTTSTAAVPDVIASKAPPPTPVASSTTAAAAAVGGEEPSSSLSSSLEAAVSQSKWVAAALISSRELIQNTLRRPFLPDMMNVSRKESDIVLAQGEDNVCGALLSLTITRARGGGGGGGGEGEEDPIKAMLREETLMTNLVINFAASGLDEAEGKKLGLELIAKLNV